MDLNKLCSLTHWLEYSSFVYNIEKSVILNNSLLVLQNDNHFKKVFLWGTIHCLDSDYFIAFGYQTDAITDRTFFYSEDCQNWKLLPVPQKEHLILTELCRRPFQGDPGLVIDVVDDAPPEEPSFDEVGSDTDELRESRKISEAGVVEEDLTEATEENKNVAERVVPTTTDGGVETESEQQRLSQIEQDIVESPIESGEIKEEDRLAAIVEIITEETAVVPRGGLFKQTDGTVVHSRAFEGLKVDEADELCSFLHYRTPQQDCNTNLLTRVDYNYAMDFLDTIDKDLPDDIWRAQLVEGDRAIILRNLTWPGFMFFHHLETPDYGFFYVGTGQRNLDVPFMTQINEPIIPSEPSVKESSASKTLSNTGSKQQTEDQGMTDTEDEILLPVPKSASNTSASTKLQSEIITSA